MKKKVDVVRVGNLTEDIIDEVVVEKPLTIIVNDTEIATLLSSPSDLKNLAVGFLISEGVILSKENIGRMNIDQDDGIAQISTLEPVDLDSFQKRIITSGCLGFYSEAGLHVRRIENHLRISKDILSKCMASLESGSKIFKDTGGVHSSALCDNKGLLYLSEDIGRHNTVDKIVGHIFLNEVDPKDKFLVTTGRISSEMILKAARAGIPLVASRSAPTDMAIINSKSRNVTLIGFLRNNRMNVYNNSELVDIR